MFDKNIHHQLMQNHALLTQAACLLKDGQSLRLSIETPSDSTQPPPQATRHYCYQMVGDQLIIGTDNKDADIIVHLDENAFADMVEQIATLKGLITAGKATLASGQLDDLNNWPAVFDVLYYRQLAWSPAAVQNLSRNLDHRFRLTDPAEEPMKFLAKNGFVVFKQTFAFAEYQVLREWIDRYLNTLSPTNKHVELYENAAGDKVIGKMRYLDQLDAHFLSLAEDPRMRQLATYAAEPLTAERKHRDGLFCRVHRSHMLNNAEQHWHKACDLGEHPTLCPGLTLALHIDDSNKDTGYTQFLAGSHQFTNSPKDPEFAEGAVVNVETQPGDVVLYYNHTLHRIVQPARNHVIRREIGLHFQHPTPANH